MAQICQMLCLSILNDVTLSMAAEVLVHKLHRISTKTSGYSRKVTYWTKLISGKRYKLASLLYKKTPRQ